jgi:Photosystem I psaA/psaB protein
METINNSIHFQLSLALASLKVVTSLAVQHIYYLLANAFIVQDDMLTSFSFASSMKNFILGLHVILLTNILFFFFFDENM